MRQDRTLTVIGRIARRYSGTIHFALLSAAELVPDRIRQLYSWNIRPLFFPAGHFKTIPEFLQVLADSIADSPTRTIRQSRRNSPAIPRKDLVFINGYKLFYFRMTRKLSNSDLSRLSGVDRYQLSRIQSVANYGAAKGIRRFKQCPRGVLTRLERALECWGQLEANKGDDFLSMYMQFYLTYKGTNASGTPRHTQLKLRFQTKVIAFDFDGTLTENLDHRTTWERIWVALGYTIEECSDLHRRFSRKEFSHEKWCELTFEKFKKARLKENLFRRIARDIKLIDGTRETLEFLKSHGVRLYIVSGSIRQIIRIVLGDLYDLFDEVKANEIRFDSAGKLESIEGTRYDFEGKAQFLRRIISDHGLSELDVLFVGNSLNDIYASRSGARTLCVNPHMTNPDIEEHWTYAIKEMTSLQQILKYVQI